MSKSNVVLTVPEPGRFELVERPYPKFLPGYAVIRTEIAHIRLQGSRNWAEHDFEHHDDPEHLATRASSSSTTSTRTPVQKRVTTISTPAIR